MSEKIEILNKLKALADHGIGGEKENAQVFLERLMKKYNVTEEKPDPERRKREFMAAQMAEGMEKHVLLKMIEG